VVLLIFAVLMLRDATINGGTSFLLAGLFIVTPVCSLVALFTKS
jgi:hypothetical protein